MRKGYVRSCKARLTGKEGTCVNDMFRVLKYVVTTVATELIKY